MTVLSTLQQPVMRGRNGYVQIVSEYFTPVEVADILKVSTDTVIRKFQNRQGVLNLGSGESRFKRRYRTLRIPREALEKFIIETRVQ